MKSEDKRKPLSARSQFLINELVNCAGASTSKFPIVAAKARARMESLHESLQNRIRSLEDFAAQHGYVDKEP